MNCFFCRIINYLKQHAPLKSRLSSDFETKPFLIRLSCFFSSIDNPTNLWNRAVFFHMNCPQNAISYLITVQLTTYYTVLRLVIKFRYLLLNLVSQPSRKSYKARGTLIYILWSQMFSKCGTTIILMCLYNNYF